LALASWQSGNFLLNLINKAVDDSVRALEIFLEFEVFLAFLRENGLVQVTRFIVFYRGEEIRDGLNCMLRESQAPDEAVDFGELLRLG
jgi:hypothetical protein